MAKLVSTTYGDAIFELAVSENKVDSLYEEAAAVVEAFTNNNELVKLLNHPKIDNNEKKKVVENIFQNFVSKDMTGLLILMVSKQRHNDIVSTLKYFQQRVKAYRHIGEASVTTAVELTEEQKSRIVKRLLETTSFVKFEMSYSIDSSLIGGMVIRIGDRVVDSSIKTKLDELSKELKNIQLA